MEVCDIYTPATDMSATVTRNERNTGFAEGFASTVALRFRLAATLDGKVLGESGGWGSGETGRQFYTRPLTMLPHTNANMDAPIAMTSIDSKRSLHSTVQLFSQMRP